MPVCGVQLHIDSASLQFKGASQPVYEGLKLTLAAGEWTCLLGPSGCGKSSLLRQLAGLIEPQHSSTLQLRCSLGESLQGQIAWMGQQDLLYPWLTVLDNVCLQHRLLHGRTDEPTRIRAMELLQQLGLEQCATQRPESLSGGMRQRVALARTLMQDKPIVLMDEPFSALDAVNRHRLQALAAELLEAKTVLLVTHDPQEALRLGQHIVLFKGGPTQALQSVSCPEGKPPRKLATLGVYQDRLHHALGLSV